MRRQGSGSIVQMSSIGGQLSFAGFSAYSATKCALEGYSEALAAAAILAALDAEAPPLRLALGNDAVDAIATHLDSVRRDLQTWESVSRKTDFDD
jgi:hypothetical protein